MRAALSRTGSGIAGLALVIGSLTGCGGDDGGGGGSSAPDAASEEDFCEAFNGFFDKVVAKATDADSADLIAALKEWAADIEEVGAPDEMPEDARNGFELFIEQAKDIDDGATLEDLQNLGQDLSEDDQEDGEAFSTWIADNCPLDIPGLPGDSEGS